MTTGRKRLPEGPVSVPRGRRFGFLEAALLLSLMAHVVAILGLFVLQKPEDAPVQDRAINVDRLICNTHKTERFKEKRVASAAPRTAQPARPQVSLHQGPVARPPLPPPRPRPVLDVEPSPTARPVAEPTPSPAALASPAPSPSPPEASPSPAASPTVAFASPSPSVASAPPPDLPVDDPPAAAASPSPAPAAMPSPSPSPRPGTREVAQDAKADFTLVVEYHNDERLPRDKKGEFTLDPVKISGLQKVKPVLLEVPRAAIPLRNASSFGLKPLSRVHAKVHVSLDLPTGLPIPVQPSQVSVTNVVVDPSSVDDANMQRLTVFIQQQVAATRWLLASDKGNWQTHSEETFTVEVVQTTDGSVAEGSIPVSR